VTADMAFTYPQTFPTADTVVVIELAQELVRRHPDARSVVAVVVLAYTEALASLLDDYRQYGGRSSCWSSCHWR